jgi:hypothetical protein
MTKEQILEIIKDEAIHLNWNYEDAVKSLDKLDFKIDRIVGNSLFYESKVRTLVAMAYRAFA